MLASPAIKPLLPLPCVGITRRPGIPVPSSWRACLGSRQVALLFPAARAAVPRAATAFAARRARASASALRDMESVHEEELVWHSLGAPAEELRLEWTLPTGQSFRWRQTGEAPLEFTGVVGQRAVRLRQLSNDVQYAVVARGARVAPAGDAAALGDYFSLGTRLGQLAPAWRAACPRYAHVSAHLQGARMLRQDPVECLFSFICSQNNHIQRIHGMVERLCRRHGTPLVPTGAAGGGGAELALHAFPTLEQLAEVTEEELRADGFGYRAKYITGSVAQLLKKPGGGEAWLLALRGVPLAEAVDALCTLPGIGPKVAACIALFSLDKHQAIPVDTHVWALACKYYTPHLRSKSLTKKVHGEVQAALEQRFGPYAGWAHNALFIAELASTRDKVPALGGGSKRGAARDSDSGSDSDGGDAAGSGSDSEFVASAGGKQVVEAARAPATPPESETTRRPRRQVAKRAQAVPGN